jgi:hypothetical protein
MDLSWVLNERNAHPGVKKKVPRMIEDRLRTRTLDVLAVTEE